MVGQYSTPPDVLNYGSVKRDGVMKDIKVEKEGVIAIDDISRNRPSSVRGWKLGVLLAAFGCVTLGVTRVALGRQNEQDLSDSLPLLKLSNPTLTNAAADSSSSAATSNIEGCPGPDPIESLKSSSSVDNVENGAVAADDPRCSEVGASILRDHGGNAIDAAVATTLCLQVVNPSSSALGGGAFILVHAHADAQRKGADFIDKRENPNESMKGKMVTEVIDCREISPLGATMDMFDGHPADSTWNGGLAIATPGQLKGLELVHSRHGRLPWATVVQPAMELARDGVVVSPYLAHAINLSSSKAKIFKHPNLANLMTKDHDGKTLLQDGDIMTNPALAKTFEAIMEGGADAIYKGDIAAQIAKDIQDAGGIITTEDLSSYRPTIRDPVVAHDIHGFTMVGVPPPSSGGAVVIGAARFLSGYTEPLSSFETTLSQHRLVEAMKHVYAIRMSLADPAFAPNITAEAVADLMQGSYMEELRRMTLDSTVLPMSKYGGDKWGLLEDGEGVGGDVHVTEEGNDNRRRRLRTTSASGDELQNVESQEHRNLRLFQYLNDHGTTHIAIVDKDGNAVTMTTTINTYFGSGVVSPSTGIIFNSQMDDFSSPGAPNHYGVAPSVTNYIAPGKKPLSSMSPTFVFRRNHNGEKTDENDLGRLVLAVGASGGPKIPTAVLQVIVNYVLIGMPLYEAIANPRLHDQLLFKGQSATLFDRSPLLQKDGLEIEVSSRTKEALDRRGHRLFPVSNTGSVQAVAIDLETGKMTAAADPRKGGKAVGY